MTETREMQTRAWNGWVSLFILFIIGLALGYWGFTAIRHAAMYQVGLGGILSIVAWGILTLVWFVLLFGFFTLQPNMSAVLILFGKYTGTVVDSGFHWANPLLIKKKVSLRAHNLNGQKLKVNDLRGNPIEIAVVVVWRVINTAKAVFDVEDFADYVTVQSEAALRHLAMAYPYDTFEGDTLSLRGSVDEVSIALQKEVAERVSKAGIQVEEARISHLAYAPEIAGAMLQRQQAEAIVSARQRIVDGAVGMVEMALAKLEEHQTIALDEERKAAMVSNLLVVLCSQEHAQPVVNAGTLYN
ncbi:MAG: SPFH domain-containing protein [Phycisphaerales bacterium]|nr:MAG: SPFH domain-containing protein [Phycisphaerales bacterium]